MFKPTYNFFNHVLTCEVLQVSTTFRLEADSYKWLKKTYNKRNWRVMRTETESPAFPDILMLKGSQYCLIEAKRLKQKKLHTLEKSLTWQWGQLGMFKRNLDLGIQQIVTVVKTNHIAFIGEEHYVRKIISDTDFT